MPQTASHRKEASSFGKASAPLHSTPLTASLQVSTLITKEFCRSCHLFSCLNNVSSRLQQITLPSQHILTSARSFAAIFSFQPPPATAIPQQPLIFTQQSCLPGQSSYPCTPDILESCLPGHARPFALASDILLCSRSVLASVVERVCNRVSYALFVSLCNPCLCPCLDYTLKPRLAIVTQATLLCHHIFPGLPHTSGSGHQSPPTFNLRNCCCSLCEALM